MDKKTADNILDSNPHLKEVVDEKVELARLRKENRELKLQLGIRFQSSVKPDGETEVIEDWSMVSGVSQKSS